MTIVNVLRFYHVRFEVIGKYFLSCKLIFLFLKKNATFLISLLTSFVIHAYFGMYNSHGEMGHDGEMVLHGEVGDDLPILRSHNECSSFWLA